MASRLPTRVRHISAARITFPSPHPLQLPSALLRSQVLLQNSSSSPLKPAVAGTGTTITTIRHVSTTAPRLWLLSSLPNLVPGTSNSSGRPPPKTIRARRLLPYTPAQVYTLIADIDSYPALADLTVGWGPFTQTYTSRVYCVPGEVVEAVSGSADTSIPREVLRSVGYEVGEGGGRPPRMEGIFESLVTRWTVKPAADPAVAKRGTEGEGTPASWTEVTLTVTFQFANPALGFAVGQVADEMVDEMVQAFEGRARQLYGR
ncbi:hypothetical protein VTH82DRAFT_1959 [Thermothelomyces myriococcoides]